jgi:hypothetical protein
MQRIEARQTGLIERTFGFLGAAANSQPTLTVLRSTPSSRAIRFAFFSRHPLPHQIRPNVRSSAKPSAVGREAIRFILSSIAPFSSVRPGEFHMIPDTADRYAEHVVITRRTSPMS